MTSTEPPRQAAAGVLLTVRQLLADGEFKLGLQALAGAAGLARPISHPRIQKPGLAIAGLVEALRAGRVQVLGSTELRYLQGLDEARQREAQQALMGSGVPAIVITAAQPPPRSLPAQAEAHGVPLLLTHLASGTFIARCHAFFDEHLSPQVALHGVLLDVFGVGVLLCGPSGIGKSECALDLILRGHRLVADDTVVARQRDRELIGTGSPLTHNHMEVRGLGIINVKDLFGAASVAARKRIELVVDMLEWQADGDYDRLGLDDVYAPVLGVQVPKVRLPIRPGRNVASIVEVAARNHLLKLQGHHSARHFEKAFDRRLAGQARPREAL